MARIRMNEQWSSVIEYFEHMYPEIAEKVVDWYPVKQMEIVVRTSDDCKYVYNIMTHNLFKFYDPNKTDIEDEETWRQEFAIKLRNKMNDTFVSQDELSYKTNISKVTLSKYMNGRATPSMYNIRRICDALGCTSNELLYSGY